MSHAKRPTDDVETPTPRESAMWQILAELAQKLSDQLRERELIITRLTTTLDTRRATMMRSLRNVVDYYQSRFRAWPIDKTITLEQKARERSEFSALTGVVTTVLGP